MVAMVSNVKAPALGFGFINQYDKKRHETANDNRTYY
jgi:hypothetical protein